jgi:ATP-dependent protease ClpP protease subunit
MDPDTPMSEQAAHPGQARAWFAIAAAPRAEADSGEKTSAEVHIFDTIGASLWEDGVTVKDFVSEIQALDVDELDVIINSPGGAAWDGLAIMNALRRHPATVNVIVDGIAASAASVIAMAGDHVTMNRGAQMMIHEASGWAQGDATMMLQAADMLNKLSDSYADVYVTRAGGDRDTWRAAMKSESWYTAEEAVLAGLADEWVDAPAAAAHFDLSGFRYPGRAQAPAPTMKLPASEPGDTTHTEEEEITMGDVLSAGLRERLGITDADVDDQTILAKLDESLAPHAREPFEPPAGTVLIDEAVLAELKDGAEQGRQALAAQASARRDALVDSAVREGRIAPVSRTQWRDMADKDEDGTTALLASMPANTIPVQEIGTGKDSEASAEAEFAKAWGMPPKEDH